MKHRSKILSYVHKIPLIKAVTPEVNQRWVHFFTQEYDDFRKTFPQNEQSDLQKFTAHSLNISAA